MKYTGNNRLCCWGGGAVYTITYSYNLAGALTQVADAAGNVTSMGYDLLGRKTSMSDPDMGQWQYQYDDAGNLVAQQDAATSGSLLAEYVYSAGRK